MALPPPTHLIPAGEARELRLVADYYAGRIDPRAFRARHPDYPALSVNPLVLEPQRGAWVYVEKFGAVVYWNCPETLISALDRDLRELEGVGERVERTRDELRVAVGAAADRVGFNDVALRELRLDTLKIVSLALAQSVALEHFELAVQAALQRFHPVVASLREEGRLSVSRREALRMVGFALDVRAEVLDNLTLFDDPPETWESEALAHLDSALFGHFDLEERTSAIQQKLAYLADAGARLMDLLATRRAHLLEWIIIGLIAFEIGMALWKLR
ncbi:MAG TPA: RMD1 family protein [Holophagaceae bacterium]|nr:RMD1 family protein [Holophagaceae bacterium]